MTKKILIVSYHFYPDTAIGARRVSELAAHFHEQGHQVTVVAARAAAQDPALTPRVQGVRRCLVPIPPKVLPALLRWHKRRRRQHEQPSDVQPAPAVAASVASDPRREGVVARLKRYFHSLEWLVDDKKLWSFLAFWRVAWLALWNRFDCVVSSGPPMSPHVATWAARPLLRCRWIMDLRDPWTDDQAWLQHIRSPLADRLNAFFERRCMARADVLVTTSPGLCQRLRQRYPDQEERIQVVLNGYDGALETSPAPTGELKLLYAGSIYYNRDPFPLLEAFARLLERPEVDRARASFLLVGKCQAWRGQDLEAWIQGRGLADCVQVRPPVPPSEVARLMSGANVLVNFAQGQPRQIPAKLFDYVAARRETLLIAETESDSAALVRESGTGVVCEPAAVADMVAALEDLYRRYVVDAQPRLPEPARLVAFGRIGQNHRFLELLGNARVLPRESAL